MDYQQTLDYLYSQLPMYQRVGAVAFKKNLDNIRFLLDFLGNPERNIPFIHIAGTNGKGSTTHMLAACYRAAGLRVGTYTSPHYKDFRERVKVNGKLISRQSVVDFVERIRSQIQDIQPSFFEITVALAMQEFYDRKVDLAIIETGLGGRLDSTNVINPFLSIITNIGYDHQAMLGDTLAEIAGEKAGIIKEKVPVVVGSTHPETAPVFRKAAMQKQAPLVFADRQLNVQLTARTIDSQTFEVFRKGESILKELILDHGGGYQLANVRTVLTALQVIKKTKIFREVMEEELRKGLANLRQFTGIMGRWQILGEDPIILADSAHNTHGLKQVIEQLKQIPYEKLHLVLGFVNDKDIEPALTMFPRKAEYYFARPDIPRGLDVIELQNKAEKTGRKGKAYHSVNEALKAARKLADRSDLIFVGGSSFVVAEVI